MCDSFTEGQHSISRPRGCRSSPQNSRSLHLALTDQSNYLTSSFSFFLRWWYRRKGQSKQEEAGEWPGRHAGPSSSLVPVPISQDAIHYQVPLCVSSQYCSILPCLPPLLSLPNSSHHRCCPSLQKELPNSPPFTPSPLRDILHKSKQRDV